VEYKVEWEENATSEVAAEFAASNDKVAIIDATHQIDRALESDPIEHGVPLNEGMFYIDRPPLRAIYSINTQARRVDVGRIRRIT
tara:strand:- start:333 stop:587 length:255 start_codon:yes stop_codon:yes gene_type:complete